MAAQTSNGSAGKRKVSNEEDSSRTPGSPASKKLKTSPDSSATPDNDNNASKPTNSTINAKPKSAAAAAISSISKAKRAPGEQAAPATKKSRRTPPRRDDAPSRINRSPSRSPPRQRKRPGQAARVGAGDAAAMRKRQAEREAERAKQNPAGNVDVVRSAYNAVPERGRDWRTTGSQIKGLRSFNNWVKSAVIQKFSPSEDTEPGSRMTSHHARGGIRVLDIGCGKGGDLQKWQNAPNQVDLYIGLDPADVSVDQARKRYEGMPPKSRGRPLFNAHFVAKDCFDSWLGDVQTVRQVGIDPNPGQGMSMPGSGGGFDVVTMMFSLHYAFEEERRARMMLRNVAGALKKGGRFIGVIPNSDVIQAKIKESWKRRRREEEGRDTPPKPPPREDGEIDEGTAEVDPDAWDPEKMLDPLPSINDPNGTSGDNTPNGAATPSPMHNGHLTPYSNSSSTLPPPSIDKTGIEWGNDLYRVTFPFPPGPPHFQFRDPPDRRDSRDRNGPFSWKYWFHLEEAVNTVPEYVVPWEAFRALASDFDLELRWMRTFEQVWEEERDDETLGPLSERMNVKDRSGARIIGDQEMEAANFYLAFCFYKA